MAKLVPILLPRGYANASKLDKRSSMGIARGLFQVADFNADIPADLLAAFKGE